MEEKFVVTPKDLEKPPLGQGKCDRVEEPYQSRLNETYDLLLALEQQTGWTAVKDDAELGVKITKATYQGKEYMKGETRLDCTLLEFADFIQKWDRRKEWDPLLQEQKPVKQLALFTYLLYLSFISPWPVTTRDLVVIASRKELADEKDTVILAAASIDDPLCPPDASKVRAEAMNGYILRPVTERDQPGLYVTAYIWVDFKGWLPGWVATMVGVEAPLVIGRIGKVIAADKAKK